MENNTATEIDALRKLDQFTILAIESHRCQRDKSGMPYMLHPLSLIECVIDKDDTVAIETAKISEFIYGRLKESLTFPNLWQKPNELAYFKNKVHSKDFWNEVDKIVPDYQKQVQWLKEYGAGLDV